MTPDQSDKVFKALAELTDAVSDLKGSQDHLTREVAKTREIVEAWGAVKTAGKFITWLGIIVGSLTAIAVGVRMGVAHLLGR